MTWLLLIPLLVQSVYAGGKVWTFGTDESTIRVPGSWGASAIDDPSRDYCPVELAVDLCSRGLDAEGYGWAYVVCLRGSNALPAHDIPIRVAAMGYFQDGSFIHAWNGPGWGPRQESPTSGRMIARFFYPVGWPDSLSVTILAPGAYFDGCGNVIARVGPFVQRTVDWRDVLSGQVP